MYFGQRDTKIQYWSSETFTFQNSKVNWFWWGDLSWRQPELTPSAAFRSFKQRLMASIPNQNIKTRIEQYVFVYAIKSNECKISFPYIFCIVAQYVTPFHLMESEKWNPWMGATIMSIRLCISSRAHSLNASWRRFWPTTSIHKRIGIHRLGDHSTEISYGRHKT